MTISDFYCDIAQLFTSSLAALQFVLPDTLQCTENNAKLSSVCYDHMIFTRLRPRIHLPIQGYVQFLKRRSLLSFIGATLNYKFNFSMKAHE